VPTVGRGASGSTAAAVAVRVGGEQGDAEDDYGRGDGGEQRDGRRPVIAAGAGSGGGRGGPPGPLVARGRRLGVVEAAGGAGTVDHAVAHQPAGQAQTLVARTRERALVRAVCRPPGRAQRAVRVPGQVVQFGPRDLELRLVRVSGAHEPDVHETTGPPVVQTLLLSLRFSAAAAVGRRPRRRRRSDDGRFFHVFGRQQRQVFERARVVTAHRHERIVRRPGRQVHLQSAVLTFVRHEAHLPRSRHT